MDEYLPLPDGVSLDGSWVMVRGEVNLDDLLISRPGRIIRVQNADSLRYIQPSLDDYARVAGMVSDAA